MGELGVGHPARVVLQLRNDMTLTFKSDYDGFQDSLAVFRGEIEKRWGNFAKLRVERSSPSAFREAAQQFTRLSKQINARLP